MGPLAFSSIFNLILILVFAFSGGCSQLPVKKEGLHVFVLKGEQERTEHSEIKMKIQTSHFSNNELSRKSIRHLKVKIKTRISPAPQGGTFWIENTTYEKVGNENLHDLALPELNETMKLNLSMKGRVLDVIGYKKNSIFYLPPVLLPTKKVNIGDYWEGSFEWVGEGNVPFKTRIECFLRKKQRWKERDVLKVEMKASTTLNKDSKRIQIQSQSSGYYLWDPQIGTVVYTKSTGNDKVVFNDAKDYALTKTVYESRLLSRR